MNDEDLENAYESMFDDEINTFAQLESTITLSFELVAFLKNRWKTNQVSGVLLSPVHLHEILLNTFFTII